MLIGILLFALLLLLAGLVLLIKPAVVTDLLTSHQDKTALQIIAVVVRLIFGLLLLLLADQSRYPAAISLLGWIAVIAAVVLMLIGPGRFKRLVKWALSLTESCFRLAALLSIALGGFLLYAFS